MCICNLYLCSYFFMRKIQKCLSLPTLAWIGLWPSWPPNHPHTLIGFITLSPLPPVSWCVVGILAHYGCHRIIQVDAAHWWWLRRLRHFNVKRFEYPEKRYIHVTNYYYYYKYLPFIFFVTLKGCITGKLVWLYSSDNLQNSKTNMTKNRDKIMNRDISKINRDIIFFLYRPTPTLECTDA